MTELVSKQTRIYSNDGKLWAGMTQKDAYNDENLLKVFTFADKNGDRVLDEKEIIRYNGPILIEDVTTKEGRFLGYHSGIFGGVISGNITMTDEVEYYPGLTIEEMSHEHSIETFRKIDSAPTDGVIQENEVKMYEEKLYTDSKNKYLEECKKESNSFYTTATIGGSVSGLLLGGLTIHKGMKTLAKMGRLGAGLAIGGISLGAFTFLVDRLLNIINNPEKKFDKEWEARNGVQKSKPE